MKLYLASSWRNTYQPDVLAALRAAGHEVYDFRNPAPGNAGFSWRQVDPGLKDDLTAERMRSTLAHPISQAGFDLDFDAMKWADAFVLLLPSGMSAHLEAGWACGAGKPVAVLAPEIREPELMYKCFEDGRGVPLFATVDEVLAYLAGTKVAVELGRRAAWVAETKAKIAALPAGEASRRLDKLVEAVTPDLVIADADGDTLTFDDASDENARAVYVEAVDGGNHAVCIHFDEERMRRLVAWGQAWLDAARLAARATAEVIAEDDGVRLLKTSTGEWGVHDGFGADDGDPESAPDWCEDEASARAAYAQARDKIACFGCAVEVTEDDSEPATEDGDRYCPKCADEAREEFKATTFAHDDISPGKDGCEWRGLGSEIVDIDEDMFCPKCDAPVQEVCPATEAAQ